MWKLETPSQILHTHSLKGAKADLFYSFSCLMHITLLSRAGVTEIETAAPQWPSQSRTDSSYDHSHFCHIASGYIGHAWGYLNKKRCSWSTDLIKMLFWEQCHLNMPTVTKGSLVIASFTWGCQGSKAWATAHLKHSCWNTCGPVQYPQKFCWTVIHEEWEEKTVALAVAQIVQPSS